MHSDAGCSRTLPVGSSWSSSSGQESSGQANGPNVALIKKEPLTTSAVPCQVAEVSTSLHATTTAVKIEPLPAKTEHGMWLMIFLLYYFRSVQFDAFFSWFEDSNFIVGILETI